MADASATDPRPDPPRRGGGEDASLTLPMLVVWHARRDLRIAFDITTGRGRRDFRDWYARRMRAGRGPQPPGVRGGDPRTASPPSGRPVIRGLWSAARQSVARSLARLPPPLRRPVEAARDRVLASRAAWSVRAARVAGRREAADVTPSAAPAAPGVRIVGTVGGESGMGHALRSFAGACDAAGVPVALVDAGLRHPSRTVAPPALAAADPAALRGNVLYMPFDRVGHAIVSLGERAFLGRTNVLVPFWELPRCPDEWRHVAGLVDEIWAPTRFIADAVAPLSSRVVHMPPCVPPPAPAAADRAAHGIPRDAFAFLTSFDFHSFPRRKNPAGTVAAFRAAFPAGTEPVVLVLRALNPDTRSAAWRRLRAAAGDDPRIRFSTRPLAHADVLALCAACDCYVSLHRAEGFGYGPAEAMLLGKPVIVTGWSGTSDYARDDNACLVRHELVAVGADDYPHHEGCVWAEPDVTHAAWHMRRLVDDAALAAGLGARGRETIRALYAPEVVGPVYRRRLATLGIVAG